MIALSFRDIARRLRETVLPETDLVIGIGSGGIVPASLVAFHLNTDLKIITLNYRDEKNIPQHGNPVWLSMPEVFSLKERNILLVDDVSVSGKTLETAMELLQGNTIRTLTMKGHADYVLFPEIQECVKWPWKS